MPDDAIPSDGKRGVVRGEAGKFVVPPVSPGRPKGSRNKLGEAFLEDMLNDWEQHGKVVIEAVRADKPDQYLKVVASILPRELNVKVGDLDELTDDQLHRQYAAIAQALVDSGFGNSAGVAAPESPQQADRLSTLQ